MVSINPKTGDILAMTSTRPYSRDQFDLATQGSRQPGSTFKPIALATAIEFGIDPYHALRVGALPLPADEFSGAVGRARRPAAATRAR